MFSPNTKWEIDGALRNPIVESTPERQPHESGVFLLALDLDVENSCSRTKIKPIYSLSHFDLLRCVGPTPERASLNVASHRVACRVSMEMT